LSCSGRYNGKHEKQAKQGKAANRSDDEWDASRKAWNIIAPWEGRGCLIKEAYEPQGRYPDRQRQATNGQITQKSRGVAGVKEEA
jgi:hypothetical protein